MPNEVVGTETGSKPIFDSSRPEGKSELDFLNQDDSPEGDVPDFDKGGKGGDDESPDEENDSPDEESDESEDTDDVDEEDSDSEDDGEDAEDDSSDEQSDDLSLYQQVKKASPDIFKKFPELKNAIFREQRYSEIFPSVEEAKTAKDRNESFAQLENDILEGKPEELLKAVEATDKTSLTKFAHGLLPALLSQNKELYSEVISLPIKRAVQQAYLQAKKAGNKNLMNAALYVDDFFFEGDGIGNDPRLNTAPKKQEKSPDVERLEKERDEHAERIRGEFNNSVIESLRFKMGKEITSSIVQFEFDEYKRKNVARDIETEVNNILAADTRYQASIRSLYKQAESAKYSSDWKARLISAYLARAKAVLPIAKKKVIEEATGRRQTPKEKKRLVPTNLSTQQNRSLNVKDIDRSKTSDRDVLEGRITFKK